MKDVCSLLPTASLVYSKQLPDMIPEQQKQEASYLEKLKTNRSEI